MIRVLIVDDNPMVRRSLGLILAREKDIEVIGEAGDGAEAVECVRSSQPDVVLMDIRMPGMDGLQATRAIKALGSTTHVLIVSLYPDATWVRTAFERGAHGYLLKQNSSGALVPAIRMVHANERYISPEIQLIAPVVTGPAAAPERKPDAGVDQDCSHDA